jgi:NAD(P)-dependent dehydrogenase (short-subunit alcohol dehydrogenase family)
MPRRAEMVQGVANDKPALRLNGDIGYSWNLQGLTESAAEVHGMTSVQRDKTMAIRRVAAVFSASRPPGIGLSIVRRLAADHSHVDLVCVEHAVPGGEASSTHVGRKEWIDSLAGEMRSAGRPIRVIEKDVTQAGEPERAVTQIVAEAGRLDFAFVMMGSTGSAVGSGPLMESSSAQAFRAVELNLVVPFLVAQACARQMISQGEGGAIVFQSSYGGVVPSSRNGLFPAARCGLNFLVKCLAAELGPHRIRVNAVNPLAIVPGGDLSANPGMARYVARSGEDAGSRFAKVIPLGRPQAPEETADVMVFLALGATFVSGESWTVSGGAIHD